MAELATLVVVAVEALVGAHPQMTLTVAKQRDHHIGLHRGGIGIIVQKGLEVVAVEPVQAIVGSNPHGAFAILAQAADEAAGELVGGEEVPTLRYGTQGK